VILAVVEGLGAGVGGVILVRFVFSSLPMP